MATPRGVYLSLVLAFCTLGIAIAGLAPLQNACQDTTAGAAYVAGVNGFSSPMLNCIRIYRYWWFVVGYEGFLILALLISTLVGGLRSQKASWMGLFAVSTLLWISMAEAFLTAQDVAWYNTAYTMLPKARVVVAGSVMTAIVNVFVTIMLGVSSDDAVKTDAEEKAAVI